MKLWRLVPQPFNKFLYILVFEQAVNCVVIIKQFSLSEICVDLSMTYSMQEDDLFPFKRFRN